MSDTHAHLSTFARNRRAELVAVFAALCVTLTLFLIGIGTARAESEAHRMAQGRSYVTSSVLPCVGASRDSTAKGSVKGWPQGMCASPGQS
ncbi:hypothetical protein [Streptomyces sp. NPDC058964]|uniref:hypothetical protein n=1 Tax=Streptomyces sp. NPDC058964 TaxID=3346681 RepID=UPI0036AC6909